QDRVSLKQAKSGFQSALTSMMAVSPRSTKSSAEAGGSAHVSATMSGGGAVAVADVPAIATALDHGSVVIAAITSCTNTSNPSVMIGAGRVAGEAVERGLKRQPWVQASVALGSEGVIAYLRTSGLEADRDGVGLERVG